MGTRSDRLLALLEREGLNPTSAAKAAKLNHRFVHDLLGNPDMSPRYDSLKRLADVLKTTPAYIEEGIEPAPAEVDKPTAQLMSIMPKLSVKARRRLVENAKTEAKLRDEGD